MKWCGHVHDVFLLYSCHRWYKYVCHSGHVQTVRGKTLSITKTVIFSWLMVTKGCDISSRDWSKLLFPSGCLWKCRSLNLQKHFAIQNGDKNIFVTTSYWLRLNTDTAERLLMLLQSAWGDEAFRKPNAI